MLIKILIFAGVFLLGWMIGILSAVSTYKGGTLTIQNEDPEKELLALKFTGDVDKNLFEKSYILLKIDRSRYHDSQK